MIYQPTLVETILEPYVWLVNIVFMKNHTEITIAVR